VSAAAPVVLLQQGGDLSVLVLQCPAVDLGRVRGQHDLHHLHARSATDQHWPCHHLHARSATDQHWPCHHTKVNKGWLAACHETRTAAPRRSVLYGIVGACCMRMPHQLLGARCSRRHTARQASVLACPLCPEQVHGHTRSAAPTCVDTESNTSSGSMPSATRRSNTSAQLFGFFSSARARRTLQDCSHAHA
jgi:hypothetical protein